MPKANQNKTEVATIESPYLAGRREWDERYGDLITRAQNWRTAALLSLAAQLVLLGGFIFQTSKSKVIPYVVAVGDSGKIVSAGAATAAPVADDRLKHAALYEWIQNMRVVTSDAVEQRRCIDKVYAMVADRSQASNAVSDFYKQASPFMRGTKELVSVDIHSIYATSPDHYTVEWTETTKDLAGTLISTQNWKGAMLIALHPPTDERLVRMNPLGIYVTNVSLTKVL